MEIKRLTLSTPSLTKLHTATSPLFSPLYITPPPPSSPYWFWATKGYVCEWASEYRGSPLVFSIRACVYMLWLCAGPLLLLHYVKLALWANIFCMRACVFSVWYRGLKGERVAARKLSPPPADRKGFWYISLALSLTLSQSIRTLSAAWMLLFQYVIHHATFGSIKLLVIQERRGAYHWQR